MWLEYVRRQLGGNNARIYDFLDFGVIQSLLDSHLKGRRNWRLLIWSLIYLEEWCRIFLMGQTPNPELGPVQ